MAVKIRFNVPHEKIMLALELIEKGGTTKDIAAQSNLSQPTVRRIRNDKTLRLDRRGQLCVVPESEIKPRDKINTLKGKLAAIEKTISDSLMTLSGNIKPDELTGMKAIDAMAKLLAALGSIKELQGEAQTQSAFRMVFHIAAQLDDIRGVDPAQFLKAVPISDISQP